MEEFERPSFPSTASKQIYQYVERHGTVARQQARLTTALPPDEFRTELAYLKEQGYLTEDGGTLRLALDVGSVEEYLSDDGTYTIRPAKHTDFEELVDTIRDVTAAETYVVAESIAMQLLYEDTVTRHNVVNSRVFFVATVDSDVVGWCHLDIPQIDNLRDVAQLTIGVRKDYRGNGIGSQLLARGLDWAEANGYRKVYNSLPVTNDNALSFLEKHGWDTGAIRKDHYTIDGEPVDEVMMAYTF